jgi:hypothetical protein
MARSFFANEQFNFQLQFALGGVRQGCGDVGELLSTTDRITDGDFDSWVAEWTATGRRIEALAEGCASAGHSVSARAAYLRASQYYALALAGVDGTREPSTLELPTFRSHRRCFDAYVGHLDPPAEKVEIPYEETTLLGYLFRPDATGRPRPTLILNNGSDSPVTAVWPDLGAGAVARGYNAITFDGPGQQSMLFLRGLPFRHDWEKVITPVADYLLTRADVDPARIALYGLSQGGYWVPRALAFEHRIAAAIADPGVYDVATSWLEQLPPQLLELLDRGDREQFNRYFELGLRDATPQERQTMAWRSKPYGKQAPHDTFTAVRGYTLKGVVDQITTPLLITDPDGEQFWPGQSKQLYDALPGGEAARALHRRRGGRPSLPALARSLTEQRILDWLDQMLDADPVPRRSRAD